MTPPAGLRQKSGPATVELRLLSLPTIEVLAAGHDRSPDERRELVVIGITEEAGTTGWGECSALNRPTYTSEWARGSFAALADLLSSARPAGPPLAPTHPMAAAGIEMALGTALLLIPCGLIEGFVTARGVSMPVALYR